MFETVTSNNFNILDDYLSNLIKELMIPNFIFLCQKNGKIVYCQKKGYKDLENKIPIEYDTIFRIHSMTKPIVAVGLMKLYEKGKFKLDDPISKYLPEFKKMTVFIKEKNGNIITEKCKEEITILHLLTHTAGTSYGYPDDPLGKIINETIAFDKIKSLRIRDYTKLLAKIPLRFQPGKHFRYGLSFEIIGSLIEELSCKRLDEYLHEEIFSPLEMNDTGYFVPDNKLDRFAEIYFRNTSGELSELDTPYFTGLYKKKNKLFFGGDGLVSTLNDYLNFATIFLNDGKFNDKSILKPKTVNLITKMHLENNETIFNKAIDMTNVINLQLKGYGQGLGVRVLINNENMKASIGEHGWQGYARTKYWVDKKQEVIGIFLSQVIPGLGSKLIDHIKLLNLAYEGL